MTLEQSSRSFLIWWLLLSSQNSTISAFRQLLIVSDSQLLHQHHCQVSTHQNALFLPQHSTMAFLEKVYGSEDAEESKEPSKRTRWDVYGGNAPFSNNSKYKMRTPAPPASNFPGRGA